MQIIVEKRHGRPKTLIKRGDGTRWSLRDPTRKYPPPHDVIHFIVEDALCLTRGLLGTIGAGGVFDSMRHLDGRRPPHAGVKAASRLHENRHELRHAECIVGRLSREFVNARPPAPELSNRCAAALGELGIDRAAALAVWQRLIEAREIWVALSLGQSLTLNWPPDVAASVRHRRARR